MGKENKGKPSGINKQEGLGESQNVSHENLKEDQRITEEYTENPNKLADHVREANPNRNTDKTDATNAGGYKQ